MQPYVLQLQLKGRSLFFNVFQQIKFDRTTLMRNE